MHQLGQRVPDPVLVALGEHLAYAGLDATDDEDAGRLGRRLVVDVQRRATGHLDLDEEGTGDLRPPRDEPVPAAVLEHRPHRGAAVAELTDDLQQGAR